MAGVVEFLRVSSADRLGAEFWPDRALLARLGGRSSRDPVDVGASAAAGLPCWEPETPESPLELASARGAPPRAFSAAAGRVGAHATCCAAPRQGGWGLPSRALPASVKAIVETAHRGPGCSAQQHVFFRQSSPPLFQLRKEKRIHGVRVTGLCENDPRWHLNAMRGGGVRGHCGHFPALCGVSLGGAHAAPSPPSCQGPLPTCPPLDLYLCFSRMAF